MLKGLVKTGYNVYMTFYGSEFITVLVYGLQRRNIYEISLHLTVSVYLVRGSFFFSFLSFSLLLARSFFSFPAE